MGQIGFFYNQQTCIGCKACQIACKDANSLPIGVLYRHVEGYETGTYPAVGRYLLSRSCNHCSNPACTAVCPTEAMHKDEDTGIVLHNDDDCIGCKACTTACPYEVPQYLEEQGIVGKCTTCADLRDQGELPPCVAACPMRALEFGELSDLQAAHPDAVSDIPCLPDSSQTTPSMIMDTRAAALESQYILDSTY